MTDRSEATKDTHGKSPPAGSFKPGSSHTVRVLNAEPLGKGVSGIELAATLEVSS